MVLYHRLFLLNHDAGMTPQFSPADAFLIQLAKLPRRFVSDVIVNESLAEM